MVQSGELLLEVPKGGIRKAGFKCSPGLYVIAVNPVRPLCTALLVQLFFNRRLRNFASHQASD